MEDGWMVKGQEGKVVSICEPDGDRIRLFTESKMGTLKGWSLADGSGQPRSVHTRLVVER